MLDPPAPENAGASSSFPPAAETGAPSEGTCRACHSSFALNSGNGLLELLDAPASYTPGNVYPLTIRLQDPDQQRWGFELTAVRDATGTGAGTLASSGNLTLTQLFGTRTYISHTTVNGADGTFFGTADGPVSWSFLWTAPAEGTGSVTFYFVGNAANGNGLNTLDFIYSKSQTIAEEPPTAVESKTWAAIKRLYR